jgi:HK97 family phage prohead protease
MQRFFAGGLEPLGTREVGVIASSPGLARDGHILEPAGIDLRNYKRNPIVLWQHMPDSPVGVTTAIGLDTDGNLAARIEFAPEGASPIADQICSLTKAGVVQGVSIGFDPLDSVPLDAKRPYSGQHILRAELLEISFVAVPADTGALVIERAAPQAMFRHLPTIPFAYVRRAAATMPRAGRGRATLPVSHTLHTWLLNEQSQRERARFASREAQLTEAERLRRIIAADEAY